MATHSLKMKIGIVEYDFDQLVDEWIIKKCRKDARKIIKSTLAWDTNYSRNLLIELIIYHERGMGNIFCCHLDFIKSKLVEFGRVKKGGCFGKPFLD